MVVSTTHPLSDTVHPHATACRCEPTSTSPQSVRLVQLFTCHKVELSGFPLSTLRRPFLRSVNKNHTAGRPLHLKFSLIGLATPATTIDDAYSAFEFTIMSHESCPSSITLLDQKSAVSPTVMVGSRVNRGKRSLATPHTAMGCAFFRTSCDEWTNPL